MSKQRKTFLSRAEEKDAKQQPQLAPEPADGAPGMIEAIGLSKYYGNFAATHDVNFRIARGEVVAFLGPNGAGKSTTMKLLTGYLSPSAGTAKIAGFDVATHRIEAAKHLGYLPENGPLYPEMTPRAALEFFGDARGMNRKYRNERIDAVVQMCDLGAVIGKPAGKLSKGYRQRVGMAQALLHEPDVLIMDEPTAGLDPNQIGEVRRMISRLGQDHTIMLSTHIMQEVDAMCSRVIFINEGRLKFDGPTSELTASGHSLDEMFREFTGTDQSGNGESGDGRSEDAAGSESDKPAPSTR